MLKDITSSSSSILISMASTIRVSIKVIMPSTLHSTSHLSNNSISLNLNNKCSQFNSYQLSPKLTRQLHGPQQLQALLAWLLKNSSQPSRSKICISLNHPLMSIRHQSRPQQPLQWSRHKLNRRRNQLWQRGKRRKGINRRSSSQVSLKRAMEEEEEQWASLNKLHLRKLKNQSQSNSISRHSTQETKEEGG